jgi:hypothetical protein
MKVYSLDQTHLIGQTLVNTGQTFDNTLDSLEVKTTVMWENNFFAKMNT